MSTTRDRFIERCEEIVTAKPAYKLGCSDKKQCDCIGMVKYGLRQCGVTLTTSGTNWTIRNQVENIREIKSTADLKKGDVVFKRKAQGDSGYNLPAKYRKGGSAYNGDLNDYPHIGTVKSVKPLRIIHMTSPTAKTDTSIGKWKVAADLKKAYINDEVTLTPTVTPDPTPEPAATTEEYAIVVAPTGKWVKMRKEPKTSCRLWEEIPVGAKVKVETHGYEWTKISYGKRKNWYMMTKFLDTIGDGEGQY